MKLAVSAAKPEFEFGFGELARRSFCVRQFELQTASGVLRINGQYLDFFHQALFIRLCRCEPVHTVARLATGMRG